MYVFFYYANCTQSHAPEKLRDEPRSDYEFKLMQDNASLSSQIKDLERASKALKAEKDSFAKQLATEKEERRKEKEERRKEKEAAVMALADAEKQSAQEKAISAQASQRLARALEAKTQENADLMQQLSTKDKHSRQLKDQLAQREKEILAMHEKLQEVNVHCQKQLEKAEHDLKLSRSAQAEGEKAALLLAQEVQKNKDLTRKYAKESSQVTQLRERLKQKDQEFKTTVENMKKEIAALSARPEVPISLVS